MSATEWVVSAVIAAEPVSTAATLATATSRFAATATATVWTLVSLVSVTGALTLG